MLTTGHPWNVHAQKAEVIRADAFMEMFMDLSLVAGGADAAQVARQATDASMGNED